MDQLIELLRQIQELAGTAIDALEGAMADSGEAAPDAAAAAPPAGAPQGEMPPG